MKRSHFTKIVSTLGPASNTPETILSAMPFFPETTVLKQTEKG